MTITVDALVKKGQLKCKEPISLKDGTAARVTITPVNAVDDPFADIIGICHSRRVDGAAKHDQYLKRKRPQ